MNFFILTTFLYQWGRKKAKKPDYKQQNIVYVSHGEETRTEIKR